MVGNMGESELCFGDTIPSSVQAPMFDFQSHPPPPHHVDIHAPDLCFSCSRFSAVMPNLCPNKHIWSYL